MSSTWMASRQSEGPPIDQPALTSRAFRNDQLPLLDKELCQLLGCEMMLSMNSGTEAVETALGAARK